MIGLILEGKISLSFFFSFLFLFFLKNNKYKRIASPHIENLNPSDIISSLRLKAETTGVSHHYPLLVAIDDENLEFVCSVLIQFNASLSKLLYLIEPRTFQIPNTIGFLVTEHKVIFFSFLFFFFFFSLFSFSIL